MGLFDQIAGNVMANVAGDKGALAQVAMEMFKQYGGMPGILQTLKDHGLATQVDSWVSTGANLPLNAEQVGAALGDQFITGIANKLDMAPADLTEKVAEFLPEAINQLTPNGVVENNPVLMLSRLMSMLK